MAINENLVEVYNDLIRINNDRIVGYERASNEARDVDVDLRSIFTRMAEESKQYAAELTQEVVKMGGEPATGTTASGKIYRVWMDVKATFTGHDRQSILESCEFGEDAAQKAYDLALKSDAEMTADQRQLITNQKASLRTSHDVIKKYRDMHEEMSDATDRLSDRADKLGASVTDRSDIADPAYRNTGSALNVNSGLAGTHDLSDDAENFNADTNRNKDGNWGSSNANRSINPDRPIGDNDIR